VSTTHRYLSNLRDIEFNLFEFLEISKHSLGKGPFASMTEETAREALRGLEQLAVTELASSLAEVDKDPPVLEKDGTVRLPEALKRSLKAYFDGGWHRLELPEHLGGFGAPPSVAWAGFELAAGAHAALRFYPFVPTIARVIDRVGTEAQKKRFLPRIVDECWGAAMVLTEPDAGSDVGAARTKARHLHDDVWELEGTKRFITNGDFDAADNIVHLVLARPEGAGPGTKGLSMFIVPKFWIEEDGSVGPRNGFRCIGLEKKMGIKGSVTCEMSYGQDGQCRGFLVGNVHDGIRQMFLVIEQARMAVGMKSMAELAAAYQHSLAYAKERVQGPDLARAAEKTSPRVRIIQHPDVRRMLMAQKAYSEGMRALALFTASLQDQVELLGGHAFHEARGLDRLNDLMLPLVKGYCSEKAFEVLAQSLQVFGGSGYVQDHPIELYIRDQKIDSLYEGTTHIQALDLLMRKVAKDGGETLQVLLGQVRKTLESEEGGAALAEERQGLQRALADMEGIFGALMNKLGESLYHVGFQGNRVLLALAELVIGWLLVRQSAVAHGKLPTAQGEDKHFYEGKIAAARWFVQNVLPGLTLARKMVENSRLELMDLPEEAF